MNYRKLGKTRLKVSEIGLGCWELGGQMIINGIPLTYGDISKKTAQSIIESAVKMGIKTFDTADSYSLGNSEKRLGRILKEDRKNVKIFTKAGIIPEYNFPLPMETDLSYEHLLASLRRSLSRLQTDKIELFQIHKPPKNKKEEKEIEKLFKKVKNENLASFCGISIGLEYEIGKSLINSGLVDTLQLYFSLIDFKPTFELLSIAKKNHVGIIVAEPLSQGFLSGKYKLNHKFNKNDIRGISYSQKRINEKIKKANQFKCLVNKKRNLSQIAISYILSRDEVSVCIPGCKTKKQLISNVQSSKIKLTKKELKHIKEIQNSWD